MPFNQLKVYNQLLELLHLTIREREESLAKVFKRDIQENHNFCFQNKPIYPVKRQDSNLDMRELFGHLTTHVVDKATNKREYDLKRCERLHWLKHHIEESQKYGILVFSVEDPDGIRTYIFDELEKYVIILNPYRKETAYYLLTAYYLEGRNIEKIKKKYKRRLSVLY